MKENKSVIVGVRLTPEEKRRLDVICAKCGNNVSSMIRELINKEFDKGEK